MRYRHHAAARRVVAAFFAVASVVATTAAFLQQQLLLLQPGASSPSTFVAPAIATAVMVKAADATSENAAEDPASCTKFAPLGRPNEFVDSAQEGIKLAVRRWEPDGAVNASLVIHHGGAGWHSGYFGVVGETLRKHGIAVVAYDQFGCGYSDSMPPSRQYFDSMETIDNDLRKMIQDTRDKYGGNRPVFALGESFGAMVLLFHMLREGMKSTADGYILCGPVIRIREEIMPPKFVIPVLKFLSRFFPTLAMPGVDIFSTFDTAFGDKRWAEAGRADPFVLEARDTPPRLASGAAALTASVNNYKNLDKVDAPFAIFVGTNDVRVYISDSERLYEVAESKYKSINVVEGGYHQLFQDVPEITNQVLDGIKDWILARA